MTDIRIKRLALRARLENKIVGNTASDIYREALSCESGTYVSLKFEDSNPSDWRGLRPTYVEEVCLSERGFLSFLDMNPFLLNDI